MAIRAPLRCISDAIARAGRRIYTFTENLLLGPEGNGRASTDPIMEVVAQSPREALTFIKVVMLFGAITGFVISAPCAAYLSLYWSACSCNKPLQWWVAVLTALQVPQLPVRYLFFCHVSSCPTDRRSILNTSTRSSSSSITCPSFLWLGTAEGFSSASRIVVSMVRLAATFVCFWLSLPPAAAAAAAAAEAGAAAAGLWRRGASPEDIQALPLITYEDKLKQYQQQQQQQQELQQQQQRGETQAQSQRRRRRPQQQQQQQLESETEEEPSQALPLVLLLLLLLLLLQGGSRSYLLWLRDLSIGVLFQRSSSRAEMRPRVSRRVYRHLANEKQQLSTLSSLDSDRRSRAKAANLRRPFYSGSCSSNSCSTCCYYCCSQQQQQVQLLFLQQQQQHVLLQLLQQHSFVLRGRLG
ncbi:hypothetical protein Efla_001600 [Eimeria flavescens]